MAKKETIPTIIDTPEALTAKMAAMKEAQKIFATYTQEQVDKIFKAAATAADKMRIPLAKMAVEETGMGIMEDKVIKNHYAAEYIYNAYKDTKTCGVIDEDKAYGTKRIAEPLGVVCAVIPTTNPTSTAIFKTLISLKTRNGIIISPHPRAKKSTAAAAKIVLDAAVAAGAKFIVSPGLNPRTVKYCVEKNIPITPGTSSPSDIEQAIELGLEVVKFFPAEQAGGLAMIKAMSAPYVNMKFMPTGGINADNLTSYLDFKKIIACGGSWMVKKDLVAAGKFDEITKLTRQAVEKMLGFEVRHVGVNLASEAEAEELADKFADMFGFEKKVGNSSIFSGTGFELMKNGGRGTHGHIAIATNYIERAIYHLERRGFKFDKDSAVVKDGKLKAIYFEGEFGGFGVHLVQK